VKAIYLPAHEAFVRYLEIPGGDPPLLWLHGWQCTSSGELLEAAVQPALAGRRCVLVDFLGHGYSDRPEKFGYTLQDHADTIVTVIDALALPECGIVGHSMGGTVAVLVASARADVVSLLVLAEGGPDPADPAPDAPGHLANPSEADYLATGYPQLLAGLAEKGLADPAGISAAHVGITRVVDPRAIYREASSMDSTDGRALAAVLVGLAMPRWYLRGELSEPEPEYERFLGESGIGLRIVPATGHAMGLQNPTGLAATVADVVAQSGRSWS